MVSTVLRLHAIEQGHYPKRLETIRFEHCIAGTTAKEGPV